MPYYEDSGELTLASFPYADIDEHVFHIRGRDLSPIEAALECQRRVWQWIYNGQNKNLDGFNDRCIVASWVFNPMLRPESVTKVAGRFGKTKQSIDRCIDDFKKEFPEVVKHLTSLRNRKR